MPPSREPIPFAGSVLTDFRHICAFFHDEEEEYRVLLPFIGDGLKAGQKAIHVVNPEQLHRHRAHLAATGVDIDQVEKRGQLELRTNSDTYINDGRFDPDRMLQSFENMASRSTSEFQFSRIVCRMDWASGSDQLIDQLVEFESRVNDVWERHDDVVICTYHLSKFGGNTVVDILRTHPMIVIGGILQHNPFFVPPKDFLQELRQRREAGNRQALEA